MLRLTDIKLPLNHDEHALEKAVLATLGIDAEQMNTINVFKRGYDARNNKDIQLIYTLDVDVSNEGSLLEKFKKQTHVRPTPDMQYKFVATAPENLTERPVVVGLGPCGLWCWQSGIARGILLLRCTNRAYILSPSRFRSGFELSTNRA